MKLNYKKTIFVGFAFLLICMFWQVYDNIIAKILINSFGLNQTWSGLIMAIDNILAIILLPIFGIWSDKTKNKHGKRTPYILIGTIVAAILIVGVSFFDNSQLAKLNAAEIGAVETVEVDTSEQSEYDVYVIKGEEESEDGALASIKAFFSNLGSDTEDELVLETSTYEDGDKLYSYEYEGTTTYFESKEEASNSRSINAGEVREGNLGIFIGMVTLICLVLVAMASFRTPAVALMPDVTPKPLRSKANAIINLMGTVGGVTALLFLKVLAKDYQSYTGTFICLGVLMVICLGIFLWKVNEPKLVHERLEEEKEYGIQEVESIEEENKEIDKKMPRDVKISFILILCSIVFWFMAYNAATSKFSVYAGIVLDTGYAMPLLVAQGVAILCYIPIGIIASKIGRKKTVIIGICILASAFLLGSFLREGSAGLIYVTMGLAGMGWATINVNSYPMIVEMSKGGNVGKYTGIYYTASMGAQIMTPILSGILMDAAGTMTVLFPYCVIFAIFALITMSFVKHGDSKPIPKSKIEALGEED